MRIVDKVFAFIVAATLGLAVFFLMLILEVIFEDCSTFLQEHLIELGLSVLFTIGSFLIICKDFPK